jgi:hypothetical protein
VSLPGYLDRSTIHRRLQVIFPDGVPQRTYCVREAATSAVFTMLYIGAVEGSDVWAGPKQVVRMTDAQSALSQDADRRAYSVESLRPGFQPEGRTWYKENSREQIRDETIRQGLIPNNAALERAGLATTSSVPRYALRKEFAALFTPGLTSEGLEKAAEAWRQSFLSATALARTVLIRRGATTTGEGILVTFPNGETRRMAPGPSSTISKAVIEEFAKRYLRTPAVLWVSESGAKVVARDDQLAAQLKLKISADRNLPDIILVDLGGTENEEVLLIFAEVVATDGPVTPQRKEALLSIATDAGFPAERVAFLTAYLDRSHSAFKKTVSELAWRSFVWFAAEPENLVVLHDGKAEKTKTLAQWL